MTILSWFENYSKDEVPPESIWEDPDGLEEWWDRVKEKRESGMTGGPSRSGDTGDEELGQNELARAFKE